MNEKLLITEIIVNKPNMDFLKQFQSKQGNYDIQLKENEKLRVVNALNVPTFEIDYLGNTVFNSQSCLKWGGESLCHDSNVGFTVTDNATFKQNINIGSRNNGISYSNQSYTFFSGPSDSFNFNLGGIPYMTIAEKNVKIPGTIIANEAIFDKININNKELLTLTSGIQVNPTNYGPLIEATNSATNRFGIGSYKNSQLNVYSSSLDPDATLNLGFAKGIEQWDNRISIQNKGTDNVVITGNVRIANSGKLQMGKYSFELDEKTDKLSLKKNNITLQEF